MRFQTHFLFAVGYVLLAANAHSAEVKAHMSDDFVEKLSDDYGAREGEKLLNSIEKKFSHAFEDFDGKIIVTIEDAKPNRPTMKQLGGTMGLSLNGSYSIGGATLSAKAIDSSGAQIAELKNEWYDSSIEYAYGKSTWGSAKRSMSMLVRKLEREI